MFRPNPTDFPPFPGNDSQIPRFVCPCMYTKLWIKGLPSIYFAFCLLTLSVYPPSLIKQGTKCPL